MAKILIAYYSRKGQNYVNGSIKNLAKGNTEIIAEFIQKAVGGELFEIDTVKNYPADYTECTNVAKVEIQQKARPDLKNYSPSIGGVFRRWQSQLFWNITILPAKKLSPSQRTKAAVLAAVQVG